MDTKEFIQKIENGDIEDFYHENGVDLVAKDSSGQAWLIENVDYDKYDFVQVTCEYIEENNLVPVKAEPVRGIVRYKKASQ